MKTIQYFLYLYETFITTNLLWPQLCHLHRIITLNNIFHEISIIIFVRITNYKVS